jgi:hypothetical protein
MTDASSYCADFINTDEHCSRQKMLWACVCTASADELACWRFVIGTREEDGYPITLEDVAHMSIPDTLDALAKGLAAAAQHVAEYSDSDDTEELNHNNTGHTPTSEEIGVLLSACAIRSDDTHLQTLAKLYAAAGCDICVPEPATVRLTESAIGRFTGAPFGELQVNLCPTLGYANDDRMLPLMHMHAQYGMLVSRDKSLQTMGIVIDATTSTTGDVRWMTVPVLVDDVFGGDLGAIKTALVHAMSRYDSNARVAQPSGGPMKDCFSESCFPMSISAEMQHAVTLPLTTPPRPAGAAFDISGYSLPPGMEPNAYNRCWYSLQLFAQLATGTGNVMTRTDNPDVWRFASFTAPDGRILQLRCGWEGAIDR